MTKEEFLELASKTFDQINPQTEETLIPLDRNIYAEIVDKISSEIFDAGVGLIEDYDLEIYSREIELSSVQFNLRDIENNVRSVLKEYFEIK